MSFGFGKRFVQARMQTAVRLGKTVSQGLMAELVSVEIAPKTLSQSAWSDYESEKSEPSLAVFRATAKVSGLPESYLAFGTGEIEVPDPRLDRKLTPLEEQRALRAADAERSAKAGQGRSKRKRSGGSK